MEKQNHVFREIGQLLSVAIASVLFGSILILSAVGPARASELPLFKSHGCPQATHYLA